MPQYRNPTDGINPEPNIRATQMANGDWLFSETGNPDAYVIINDASVYEC